ncbi:MAG: Arginine decarboxylase [Acidimicrobiales bacterium]|nr:Arginine decarboxylase [Acidimicrobiales bacterium]
MTFAADGVCSERLEGTEPALAAELRRAWAGEHRSYHMPGHKSGRGASALAHELLGSAAFEADLSEVGGFDYLHAPTGALAEAQRRAAELFGADRTWFLVNGSTVGNMAAICATVKDGDEIVVARSSHRSVSAGLTFSGATPVYLAPVLNRRLDAFWGVDPEDVRRAFESHPKIRAVHITSPDYYGFSSGVAEIAAIAHEHGVPLIVDEAHGTHFAFNDAFAPSALASGADLVVQSAHKTLGSLTQSSLLHSRGDLVSAEGVAVLLQTLQSSSPSALLLISLDLACAAMADEGRVQLTETVRLAALARQRIASISGLDLYGAEIVDQGAVTHIDPTKLVVDVYQHGVSGFAAAAWLREHRRINPEFADLRRMVFSITNGDDETSVEILVESLTAMATCLQTERGVPAVSSAWSGELPEVVLTPRRASQSACMPVPVAEALGRVAAEVAIPYPPGIPLLAPGERITPEVVEALHHLARVSCRIVGPADPTMATLRCVVEEDE